MGYFTKKFTSSETIIDKFDLLDIACKLKGIEAQFLLLGGSGLLVYMELMHQLSFRPTSDIDVKLLAATDEQEVRNLLQETQIEILGGTVEVPDLEEFKKSELYAIDVGFKAIEVYLPTIEMLACTKIFSKREKDLEDLKNTDMLLLCNKGRLLEMVEDYKGYVLNPEHSDWNFYQLENIFNEKGILLEESK